MNKDFCGFKFRKINKYLIESLVNPSLYFAKPDTLNDPFDCRLNLKQIFKKIESSSTFTSEQKQFISAYEQKFFDDWESKLGAIGVCSFSSDMNETLLWSHYADDHKGVCLGYKLPTAEFKSDKKFQFIGADKVKYSSDLMWGLFKKAPMKVTDFVDELIKIYLTTKDEAWDYEKEKRIIRGEHGKYNINGKFLRQICFGLQTPKNDIDLIIKLAKTHCGCENFAQMVPDDERDFGLKPQKLNV